MSTRIIRSQAARRTQTRKTARTQAAETTGVAAVEASDAEAPANEAAPPESDATVQPRRSPVIIEVDGNVTGGVLLDRFDVLLRARVVSITTIRSATLIADGGPRSSMSFGPEPSELTQTLPNGVVVQQRTLQFALSRRLDAAGEPCPCRIVTVDEQGTTHEQDFELVIDPAASPPVRIGSGPLQPPATTGDRVPVILYVERAVIEPGGKFTLEGWAISLTQVMVVQAYLGEHRIVARMRIERGDVAQAYPAYPGSDVSGFQIVADLPEGLRDTDVARVEVMCRHGLTHDALTPIFHGEISVPAPPPEPEPAPTPTPAPDVTSLSALGQGTSYSIVAGFQFPAATLAAVLAPPPPPAPAPPPEPDREIHMFCDEIGIEWNGQVVVSGWATSAAGIARVAVLVDDQPVGVAELGHDRPDVGEQHAGIHGARYSGFRFDRVVADHYDGEHNVRVVVITQLGDERIEDAVAVATAAPAPPPPPPEPEPPPPVAAPAAAVSAEPDPAQMKFQLDSPRVQDGKAAETITGRLTIDGWMLARSPVVAMEVWMGTQRLGDAHHGLARQDVGAAFPEWPNSVRSGYAFHCPPRSLRDGTHTIRLVVRCENGYEFERGFDIEVRRTDTDREAVGIQRRLPRTGRSFLAGQLDRLDHHPPFTVILRQDGPIDAQALTTTLLSLDTQAYTDWRLICLCDQPDAADALRPLIDSIGTSLAWRTSVLAAGDIGWGEAIVRDPGAFHVFLRPGDELGVDALAELALGSGLHRDADLIYADESRISPITQEREAFLKPDYSPDLLLSTNYIGRPWSALGSLLARTGVTPASLAEHGEYDLVLHCAEQAAMVHHVPKLLCQRGVDDPDSLTVGRRALERALDRRGIAGEVASSRVPQAWRVRRTTPVKGKVSIIIPTCAAHGHIERCIGTLREQTAYRDYEIIVIDNIPDDQVAWKVFVEQNADKVVDIPDAFNWSRFNNRAADVADGEFILFLNDDIEIEQRDWLDTLLENAVRPEVGIVGPRLLYPSRTVQHAGMFLATNGIARHAFRFAAEDDPCYFGLALTQRNVMAVTGACMLMRREVYEALGRFDEAHSVVNNDLDLCLRAHRAGLLTVYTPHATLIHHELASRDKLKDVYDATHFNSMWADQFNAGDPYFNPRLYRHADDQRPDDEPVEVVYSGQPLFTPEEIRRLLVVKLDHIGDFITALPSIRRLKELFPLARITVLSAPAAQSFAAFEPAIDEFIAFEFFHVKSGLGRKEVTQEDLIGLGTRLRPQRFDLAVDLRKQPDTRDVLKHSGARYLAGYDHQAQFNFLDVALEWETDRSLHHKRNHVSDDLLNLVEAVGQASRFHQPHLAISAEAASQALDRLPEAARRMFDKPVAVIHPGVGSAVKQWPLPYFAALTDLLVKRHGLNIIMIGSPDEAELAQEVLDQVTDKSAVVSLVGQTPLRELPALLANARLYVGNDSGPKHIAAAVGVPSIGIHSGVVDTMEWGPVGPSAIALRRNMACSPCYLARQEDCPRALACLKGLEPMIVYEAAVAMLAQPLPRVVKQPLVYRPIEVEPEPEPAATPEPEAAPEPVAASEQDASSEPAPPSMASPEPAKRPRRSAAKAAPKPEPEQAAMAEPATKSRRRRSDKAMA